jgi:predicted aldo/keto reductase-like oxidoreductase
MKAAAETRWTDVVHVRINPYGIAMDKPDPQEVINVINQLHKAGKGVIGMKLVGNGKLRNEPEKIQNTLRFVLGLGSVNMMIIGFEEKDQIDNYLSMAENVLSQM